MYLPYFRGRQFELIALRELIENSILSKHIVPIIEPVKISSTLGDTIKTFNKDKRLLSIVSNPQVGKFMQGLSEDENEKIVKKIRALEESENIIKIHILNSESEKFLSKLSEKTVKNIIFLCNNADSIDFYNKFNIMQDAKYNLIPDESIFRRAIRKNRILFDDKFIKKNKNVAYADNIDEPFSSDHLYYKEEGYIGFSDFSIIGDEYDESGFAPYAVAIHIIYFDDKKNLRIRHFVSDSNSDISNTAGKFGEALKKLTKWNKDKKLDTFAMRKFQEMDDHGKYPGLGTVKKLSIMHHIELIGKFLDE